MRKLYNLDMSFRTSKFAVAMATRYGRQPAGNAMRKNLRYQSYLNKADSHPPQQHEQLGSAPLTSGRGNLEFVRQDVYVCETCSRSPTTAASLHPQIRPRKAGIGRTRQRVQSDNATITLLIQRVTNSEKSVSA